MEILRIVAMLMIIMLHYLDKGGILGDFALKMGYTQNIAWIIEALCMVSVNIYVLISGYFLSTSQFKIKKLIILWAQVLFYSWIIFAIMAIANKGRLNFEKGIYDIIPMVMPVTGSHYWFATVYIMLYMFFPFINKGIDAMDRKQFRNVCIAALTVFSAWNTILPFTVPRTDMKGMDICWFVCLYLTAAYIRKYKDDIKISKWIFMILYVSLCVTAFLLGKGLLFADSIIGKLGGFAGNLYAYNSLFIFAASVSLFIFTVKSELKCPKALSKIIMFMSQGTFGVYLIHEHLLVRYQWPEWFKCSDHASDISFILHAIICVGIIFVTGVCIDFIRRLLFGLFGNKKKISVTEEKQ